MNQYLKNVVTCNLYVFSKHRVGHLQNSFYTYKYYENTRKYYTCSRTHFSSIGSMLVSIITIPDKYWAKEYNLHKSLTKQKYLRIYDGMQNRSLEILPLFEKEICCRSQIRHYHNCNWCKEIIVVAIWVKVEGCIEYV